jgi:hypothetical protein
MRCHRIIDGGVALRHQIRADSTAQSPEHFHGVLRAFNNHESVMVIGLKNLPEWRESRCVFPYPARDLAFLGFLKFFLVLPSTRS